MNECHKFIIGPFGRLVIQHCESLVPEPLQFGMYIINLESYVMHPFAFIIDIGCNHGIAFSGAQQLNLGLPYLEKGRIDLLAFHDFALIARGAKQPFIGFNRRFQILNSDANVIDMFIRFADSSVIVQGQMLSVPSFPTG